MLATALICGIGLLMHIRNRKKKSFFEMEFKVRPMPKCKPALDYPETNHYDAVDALASALRAYKIPKADSFDPERLTLKEYLELAGYKRGNTEIDIKERQDNGWPCSKPIKSTTFYKKDNTIIKIIKGDQIAEEDKFIEALYDFNNCTGATERAFNEAMIITEEKEMGKAKKRKSRKELTTDIRILIDRTDRIKQIQSGSDLRIDDANGGIFKNEQRNEKEFRALHLDIKSLESEIVELRTIILPQLKKHEKQKTIRRNREMMFNKLLEKTGKVPTEAQVKESLEIIDNDL